MTFSMRLRLSLMMFLQFFVWGAWWVPFGSYLAKIGLDTWIGTMFSAQGLAAILSPLFVGAIADRYLSAHILTGILQLLGAAALTGLSLAGANPAIVFLFTLGTLMAYMPTLALVNTIAFGAMENTEREFPAIRVLGTLGWIVAGLLVGWLHAEQSTWPIRLAAGASVVYGLYCFTLPATPPGAGDAPKTLWALLGIDAIRSGDRSFWTLVACSLLLMVPLSFYYAYANAFLVAVGVQGAAGVQTIGQVSEVGFLLLLPVFLRWFGMKAVLLVGMLAWTARYILFAYGFDAQGPDYPMLLAGLALHGVCYDFFLVAGQIWVDQRFPVESRARAQSFLALVTWGVGSIVGSLLANAVFNANAAAAHGMHDWTRFWTVPALLAAIVALLFALLFQNRTATHASEKRS
ncbi:MFS transporter [Novosphingobium sp. 1949]|uniref:MFS transporter n=1 Tax=Novosphingobium organovorum TaxID=2930092 RepID=A0ABT0BBK7_9SPHN|nr:MFS transporter [Novosphingobium organovorum]MCJ2182442.1 MFS transporter [Novosphingobium organovorum]